MTTGQIIAEARKKAGMTQEDLADKLGVTRQAVSKWESDTAYPETEKIRELCKLFSLSADDLLFGENAPSGNASGGAPVYGTGSTYNSAGAAPFDNTSNGTGTAPSGNAGANASGNVPTWGVIPHANQLHFEYISKHRVCGIPLLHINIGLGVFRAKGIFAFGNIAIGLVSGGFLSLGLLSFGILSLALISLGDIAFGLIAFGGVAVGLMAFGGVAIGVMSFGGLAIGYCAVGGAAIGQFAAGDWASGWLAIGVSHAEGTHAFTVPDMLSQLLAFLGENVGGWLGGFLEGLARSLGS